MNKFLRYSFIVLLALVCGGVNAQEVTLDFTDNTKWKFPEGNQNAAKDATAFSNGAYTITVAAPTAYYWFSSNSALLYGKNGATITLPKFNFDVERIDIVSPEGGSGKTTRNIYVGETAVSKATTGAKGTKLYEIAASNQAANTVYTIKVTNANNDQIQKILIWKKGTAGTVETPKADNIAAFKAIGVGNNAILTLKDAKVQYVNSTDDIYIVDATGGIDIYKAEGLTYKAGQVLNGTITATYDEFKALPELKNITENKLTATDGTIEPIEMTAEEAAKAENVCKLVTVKNIKLIEIASGNYKNYYNDEDKTLQIYNKFRLDYTPNTEAAMDYTGILIPYNSQIELAPTVAPTTTGINNITTDAASVNAPAYNLAGQKVSASYKGVVVKAGKKYIQK